MQYSSADTPFTAHLPQTVVDEIVRISKQAKNVETGGILVGCYNDEHSCAMIDQATGPPQDSRHARTWFHRGIAGLQNLLDRLWHNHRRYYLGEWHYHPGGTAAPSSDDQRQMVSISHSKQYACPEPLLLIVARNPSTQWDIAIYVYPRDRHFDQLKPTVTKDE